MGSYRIALLPGDGIGPEVMEATLPVLTSVVATIGDLHLDWTSHTAGAEHYRQTGDVLPRDVLDDCLSADAVLLAAIGLPDVRTPDGTEVQPVMMVGLRRALQLYGALRPVKLYPGVDSPLKDISRGIDFVIVRENLEGLFSSFGGGAMVGDDVVCDSLVITRKGTERVSRLAFETALQRASRRGGTPHVTCVDKANVFRSFAFFRRVFHDVSKAYPQCETRAEYVDAHSLLLVQQPHQYDVIVTENQFGDILSDLAAALVGGLGLAPSAELGDDHALFQPSHGTAPQLAGRDLANPLANILSASMMLDWLGIRHQDESATQAAGLIEDAVCRVLAEGKTRTADLGGSAGTRAVGEAVAAAIAEQS